MYLVLLLAVLWGSTSAVTNCNQSIINKLKTCYIGGQAPPLLATGGKGTHILISKGELPPETYCVTATQYEKHADVVLTWKNGGTYPYTVTHVVKDIYIEEKDDKGQIYRLYIIYNSENVYTYYRCIPDGSTAGKGSETHMVDVAIACSNVNDQKSKRIVDASKECFAKLDITNYITMPPCC